jgi:drug/metabolite transporter (DMT)-like permease
MAIGARPVGKGIAVSALFLLSLLWALDGLGPDLLPALRHAPMPAMERQAITYALMAMLAAAYARKQRARFPDSRSAFAWAGLGLLLFAVPAVLAAAAQGWVSQLERVAIFSLTPVFAVVFEPHLGNAPQRSNGALIAALAAVAGALCIFPLNMPGTPSAFTAALAVVLAAACAAIGNCLAVRLASSNFEGSFAFGATLASGSAAIAFGITSVSIEHAGLLLPRGATQIAWLVCIDAPALLLLFWLLRKMSAVRMTTRFVLAPLLTVIAGIAIEQPAITTRMFLGIGLMAAGAMWLLFAPDEDNERGTLGIL